MVKVYRVCTRKVRYSAGASTPCWLLADAEKGRAVKLSSTFKTSATFFVENVFEKQPAFSVELLEFCIIQCQHHGFVLQVSGQYFPSD